MPQHPNEIQRLFAQQDATAFRPPTSTEANTLLGIAETVVDFTPIVGDIKALTVDAPRSFAGGHPILGSIDVLSAVPLLGLPFDFIRKGMRAAGRGVRKSVERVASITRPNTKILDGILEEGKAINKAKLDAGLVETIEDSNFEALVLFQQREAVRSQFARGPLEIIGGVGKTIKKTAQGLSRAGDELIDHIEGGTTLRFLDRVLPGKSLSQVARDIDEGILFDEIRTDRLLRGTKDVPSRLPTAGPTQESIDQVEALARRRTGTPQRQAIEESRRATREVRRALDEGRPDDARRLMRQLIERDRAPLDPTR